jgi:hypothetical protein
VAVFAVVSASRNDRRQVLGVVRDVPAGHTLTAQDVRAVSVTAAAGVDLVPAGGEGGVVGRPAAVPLTGGSLLAAGQVGPVRVPPAGQAVVGAAVRAGQYPAELTRGDKVSIVLTQPAAATGTAATTTAAATAPGLGGNGSGATDGWAVEALVVGMAPAEQGAGGAVVSLQLADVYAQTVARAAAAGQVALVRRAASP